jgi:hypothetical protein
VSGGPVIGTPGGAEGSRGEPALRRRTNDDGGTHLEPVADGDSARVVPAPRSATG